MGQSIAPQTGLLDSMSVGGGRAVVPQCASRHYSRHAALLISHRSVPGLGVVAREDSILAGLDALTDVLAGLCLVVRVESGADISVELAQQGLPAREGRGF